MSPDVFSHHVNDTKTISSHWIRDVGDVTLAYELSAVTSPTEAARMTSQRVAWLHGGSIDVFTSAWDHFSACRWRSVGQDCPSRLDRLLFVLSEGASQ